MSEETKSIKINPTYNKVVKNYNKSFTMYAETDLDQPTDYSLRYAEDDSDSSDTDDCNKNTTTATTTITTTTTVATSTTVATTTTTTPSTKNEFVQDTIKTYCTEDTPYETPFNFSTATSMSDLRIDDKPIDKLDNNDAPTHNKVVLNDGKIVKSEFSSGLMSPEKPINYCEEGTPGYFSRVPSFSSLNSVTVNENESTTMKTDKIETKIKETKRNSEVKAVKFEKVVNYAEETPLMFSRSSSLASLDSIEQHSIHDDKSSVISDFSRLTSGLVSPSELPDSPTQTIPPSPKSRQSKQQKHPPDNVVQTSSPKGNVFEDSVKKFKLESTPIQFSRATSLSSLTIDENDGNDRQRQEQNQQESIVEEDRQEQQLQQEQEEVKIEEKQEEIPENSTNNHIEEKLDDNNESSESEEEDEDMLAACINIGIQNNRYSQQKSNCSSPDLQTFNYPKNQLNDLNQRWVVEEETKNNIPLNSVVDSKIDLNISLETNLGNSTQSLSSISDNDDDTSSESGGAALLEECILAGMPKKSNIPSNNSLSIKSNELTEAEQQLLEQCILDGMKKSRLSPKKQLTNQQKHQLTNDLTESERSLLQQCIMAGMQKNNHNNNHHHHRHHQRPSTSKDNPSELTYTERRLLEQCILDGMPKTNRSINNNNRPINSRRIREYERLNQQSPTTTTTTTTEHTCCIHCPRNQQKQLMLRQNNNHLRMKKKLRNHEQRTQQIHLRENKDINILYVTSQILALKKEMIDRSHEEWV